MDSSKKTLQDAVKAVKSMPDQVAKKLEHGETQVLPEEDATTRKSSMTAIEEPNQNGPQDINDKLTP